MITAAVNSDITPGTAFGGMDIPDPEICRQARLARDSRFYGEFFLAVHTTGIYCRPICPARAPAEKNVRYYRSSAQAARDGYRPCLRCRPESAPNSPAWQGTATTVQRALQLIQEGALNRGTLAALPVTEVAFAAGFGSLRRFNSAVKAQFRQTPGNLRRRPGKADSTAGIRLQLQYRPPYDWRGVGPWTLAMVAMRGAGDPDVFPNRDLGLEKAWMTISEGATPLQARTAGWRPWRSYAANLLWRSL